MDGGCCLLVADTFCIQSYAFRQEESVRRSFLGREGEGRGKAIKKGGNNNIFMKRVFVLHTQRAQKPCLVSMPMEKVKGNSKGKNGSLLFFGVQHEYSYPASVAKKSKKEKYYYFFIVFDR